MIIRLNYIKEVLSQYWYKNSSSAILKYININIVHNPLVRVTAIFLEAKILHRHRILIYTITILLSSYNDIFQSDSDIIHALNFNVVIFDNLQKSAWKDSFTRRLFVYHLSKSAVFVHARKKLNKMFFCIHDRHQ